MGVTQALRSGFKRIVPVTLAAYVNRKRPTGIDRKTWDREYAAGEWDFLGTLVEMPRYSVVAGYCDVVGGDSSVLDLGCGPGLLHTWLSRGKAQRYLGVDLSEAAISKARDTASAPAQFEVADAAQFDIGSREKFDAVVLNEMLYYVEHPELLVKRCADFLVPNGSVIVSMYKSSESLLTWRRCADLLEVLDEVSLSRPGGLGWHIRFCRLANR